MHRREVLKLASAALVVAVLLGSKLVGPVNGCGSGAAASACAASQSATPGKIPGSAWLLRDRSSYRPL
ncbi:MAG TPA: hypothetical protein VMU42_01560 [Candidatus Sulfotelmatobacter sp.]|nr:hypothetical protein [Candidatus Sulfotelmatobacter sp.]